MNQGSRQGRRLSHKAKGVISLVTALGVLAVLILIAWQITWIPHSVDDEYGEYYEAAMAMDAEGSLHILCTLRAQPNTPIDGALYLNNSGGDWRATVISNYTVYEPAIAMDSRGNAHVICAIYNASETWSLVYFTNVGGAWSSTVIDTTPYFHEISSCEVVVDCNDKVHICYSRKEFGQWQAGSRPDNMTLMYATNRDGTWDSFVLLSTIGYENMWVTDIAVDAGCTPYVTAKNVHGSRVSLFTGNADSTWNHDFFTAFGSLYGRPLIAVGNNGALHLIYSEHSYNTGAEVLTHATNSSGTWEYREVAKGEKLSPIEAAIEANGRLHALYLYAHYSGGPPERCSHLEIAGDSVRSDRIALSGSWSLAGSLCLDKSGNAYIPLVGEKLGYVTDSVGAMDRIASMPLWIGLGGLYIVAATAYASVRLKDPSQGKRGPSNLLSH